MAHGVILVLGGNPERLLEFVIDYDQPESTHTNCVCDGIVSLKTLPFKGVRDLQWVGPVGRLDLERWVTNEGLLSNMNDVCLVLMPDNTWCHYNEGYGAPSPLNKALSEDTIADLTLRFAQCGPETLVVAFDAHF